MNLVGLVARVACWRMEFNARCRVRAATEIGGAIRPPASRRAPNYALKQTGAADAWCRLLGVGGRARCSTPGRLAAHQLGLRGMS